MVTIPAGDFLMGCDPAKELCQDDNVPAHVVYLASYKIDRVEVTVAAYKLCVEAGACEWPPTTQDLFDTGNWLDPDSDALPMNFVNWYSAKAYCAWAGKRLPTEAEWEKAARGTDGRVYPWGDGKPQCCHVASVPLCGGGYDTVHNKPVGTRPSGASPYGVLDMIGSQAEWAEDVWNEHYYVWGPRDNPPGPPPSSGGGDQRVLRDESGFKYGPWGYPDEQEYYMGVSSRTGRSPYGPNAVNGFRCAADLEP
jgi:formylglycine-generating enzyme required for sulfatase activity